MNIQKSLLKKILDSLGKNYFSFPQSLPVEDANDENEPLVALNEKRAVQALICCLYLIYTVTLSTDSHSSNSFSSFPVKRGIVTRLFVPALHSASANAIM